MYGKYSYFTNPLKNLGYFTHVQTVSTRPPFRGREPGDKTTIQYAICYHYAKLTRT